MPHLFTLLRLLIAGLGVAFIVWSLTWTDRLVLPAEHELVAQHERPIAQRLEPVRVRVTARPEQSSDGQWHIQLPAELGGGEASVAPDTVGAEGGQVRYEPGVGTTIWQANWLWLGFGLVLMGAVPSLQALRWWLLMRCRGLDPGYLKSLRLTLVGLFFNFSLPGMTGGDLVKAYYAAKGSGAGSTAVMSVIFDRITGMIGLLTLAGLAGLWVLDDPLVARITASVWLVLSVLIAGGHIYLSRRVRGRLRRGSGTSPQRSEIRSQRSELGGRSTGDGARRSVIPLIPDPWSLIPKLDRAAAAYRGHLPTLYLAIAVSLPVHLAQMTAAGLAGQALGMELSLWVLVALLPVVFFAGTLPISYQGLGVMEAVALALLLSPPEATANQVVGMLLLARLFIVCYALIGAVVVLRGDMHMFPQHARRLLEEPDANADTTAPHPASAEPEVNSAV